MKNTKKWIALLLALVMCAGLFGVSALAEAEESLLTRPSEEDQQILVEKPVVEKPEVPEPAKEQPVVDGITIPASVVQLLPWNVILPGFMNLILSARQLAESGGPSFNWQTSFADYVKDYFSNAMKADEFEPEAAAFRRALKEWIIKDAEVNGKGFAVTDPELDWDGGTETQEEGLLDPGAILPILPFKLPAFKYLLADDFTWSDPGEDGQRLVGLITDDGIFSFRIASELPLAPDTYYALESGTLIGYETENAELVFGGLYSTYYEDSHYALGVFLDENDVIYLVYFENKLIAPEDLSISAPFPTAGQSSEDWERSIVTVPEQADVSATVVPEGSEFLLDEPFEAGKTYTFGFYLFTKTDERYDFDVRADYTDCLDFGDGSATVTQKVEGSWVTLEVEYTLPEAPAPTPTPAPSSRDSAPKTGDDSAAVLWAVLVLGLGSGAVILGKKKSN